jgi:hypothetical protein
MGKFARIPTRPVDNTRLGSEKGESPRRFSDMLQVGKKRQDRAFNRAAGAVYPASRAIRLNGITSGTSSWHRYCMT